MEEKRKKPTFKKSEITLSATADGYILADVVTDDGQYHKKKYEGYTKAEIKSMFYQEFSRI